MHENNFHYIPEHIHITGVFFLFLHHPLCKYIYIYIHTYPIYPHIVWCVYVYIYIHMYTYVYYPCIALHHNYFYYSRLRSQNILVNCDNMNTTSVKIIVRTAPRSPRYSGWLHSPNAIYSLTVFGYIHDAYIHTYIHTCMHACMYGIHTYTT